jgi:acyl carrier protein
MSDVTTETIILIERVTEIPAADIAVTSRFESMANWTSLAALELLANIEDRFGVKLDLRAYFAVAEVGELASLVSAALGDRAPADGVRDAAPERFPAVEWR